MVDNNLDLPAVYNAQEGILYVSSSTLNKALVSSDLKKDFNMVQRSTTPQVQNRPGLATFDRNNFERGDIEAARWEEINGANRAAALSEVEGILMDHDIDLAHIRVDDSSGNQNKARVVTTQDGERILIVSGNIAGDPKAIMSALKGELASTREEADALRVKHAKRETFGFGVINDLEKENDRTWAENLALKAAKKVFAIGAVQIESAESSLTADEFLRKYQSAEIAAPRLDRTIKVASADRSMFSQRQATRTTVPRTIDYSRLAPKPIEQAVMPEIDLPTPTTVDPSMLGTVLPTIPSVIGPMASARQYNDTAVVDYASDLLSHDVAGIPPEDIVALPPQDIVGLPPQDIIALPPEDLAGASPKDPVKVKITEYKFEGLKPQKRKIEVREESETQRRTGDRSRTELLKRSRSQDSPDLVMSSSRGKGFVSNTTYASQGLSRLSGIGYYVDDDDRSSDNAMIGESIYGVQDVAYAEKYLIENARGFRSYGESQEPEMRKQGNFLSKTETFNAVLEEQVYIPRIIGLHSNDVHSGVAESVVGAEDLWSQSFIARNDSGEIGILRYSGLDQEADAEYLMGAPRFIPLKKLILDGPLSSYVAKESLRAYFPGQDLAKITNQQMLTLFETIARADMGSFTFMHSDGTKQDIQALIKMNLTEDGFSTRHSYLPKPQFLHGLLENFDQYMEGHTHYGFGESRTPARQAIYSAEPELDRYLSYGDGVRLITSRRDFEKIGLKGKDLIGAQVVHLDNDHMPQGATLFDKSSLDQKNYDRFVLLANRANQTHEVEDVLNYVQFLKSYSNIADTKAIARLQRAIVDYVEVDGRKVSYRPKEMSRDEAEKVVRSLPEQKRQNLKSIEGVSNTRELAAFANDGEVLFFRNDVKSSDIPRAINNQGTQDIQPSGQAESKGFFGRFMKSSSSPTTLVMPTERSVTDAIIEAKNIANLGIRPDYATSDLEREYSNRPDLAPYLEDKAMLSTEQMIERIQPATTVSVPLNTYDHSRPDTSMLAFNMPDGSNVRLSTQIERGLANLGTDEQIDRRVKTLGQRQMPTTVVGFTPTKPEYRQAYTEQQKVFEAQVSDLVSDRIAQAAMGLTNNKEIVVYSVGLGAEPKEAYETVSIVRDAIETEIQRERSLGREVGSASDWQVRFVGMDINDNVLETAKQSFAQENLPVARSTESPRISMQAVKANALDVNALGRVVAENGGGSRGDIVLHRNITYGNDLAVSGIISRERLGISEQGTMQEPERGIETMRNLQAWQKALNVYAQLKNTTALMNEGGIYVIEPGTANVASGLVEKKADLAHRFIDIDGANMVKAAEPANLPVTGIYRIQDTARVANMSFVDFVDRVESSNASTYSPVEYSIPETVLPEIRLPDLAPMGAESIDRSTIGITTPMPVIPAWVGPMASNISTKDAQEAGRVIANLASVPRKASNDAARLNPQKQIVFDNDFARADEAIEVLGATFDREATQLSNIAGVVDNKGEVKPLLLNDQNRFAAKAEIAGHSFERNTPVVVENGWAFAKDTKGDVVTFKYDADLTKATPKPFTVAQTPVFRSDLAIVENYDGISAEPVTYTVKDTVASTETTMTPFEYQQKVVLPETAFSAHARGFHQSIVDDPLVAKISVEDAGDAYQQGYKLAIRKLETAGITFKAEELPEVEVLQVTPQEIRETILPQYAASMPAAVSSRFVQTYGNRDLAGFSSDKVYITQRAEANLVGSSIKPICSNIWK